MKKFLFLILISCMPLIASAQYYRHVVCSHPYATRTVVVEPSYQEVIVVERVIKKMPKKVIINNIIEEDVNEYEVVETNNNVIVKGNKFGYENMWKQTVWFKEDSYQKVRNDGKIAMDNAAKFLAEHCDAKLILEGYASKRHGTYDYNMMLASNRVKTVLNYMVNVYHIDWSRIEAKVIGTNASEYDIDEWNQCVVMSCSKF